MLFNFSGLLGAIFLIFGIIGGVITAKWSLPVLLAHFVLGALLSGAWLFRTVCKRRHSGVKLSAILRHSQGGLEQVLTFLALISLFVVINWAGNNYNYTWDFSVDQRGSLAPETKRILENLTGSVKLVGFGGSNFVNEKEMQRLMSLFRRSGAGKVDVQYVDARLSPELIERYKMRPGEVLYVSYTSGDKRELNKKLTKADEGSIRQFLLRAHGGPKRAVYFLQGHGEPDLHSVAGKDLGILADALEGLNIAVKPLNLLSLAAVPDDADAVVIASPTSPLMDFEHEEIIRYADSGGSLLLITDPRRPADVQVLARRFGIEIGDDVIIDELKSSAGGGSLAARPFVSNYGAHPATSNMGGHSPTTFQLASSVSVAGKAGSNESFTEILKSSKNAWAERNLGLLFDSEATQAVFDHGDLAGPVSLAVSYERILDSKRAIRVIAIGDLDWVRNENIAYLSNKDLAINLFSWLTREAIYTAPAQPSSAQRTVSAVPLSREMLMSLLLLSFLVPELILITGLSAWCVRRRTCS